MPAARARAHASIANLGHGFDVFAVAVTLAPDEVEVRRARGGDRVSAEGPGAGGVPLDPRRNTASVAVRRLLHTHGVRAQVHVRIVKCTRFRGGVGSSAASAAAAVLAANELFELAAPRAALVPCAAWGERAAAGAAHADNVAASLFGGFVVTEPRDPTRVVRVPTPAALRFVLAFPALALTTAEARRVLPRRLDLADHAQGCARAAAVVAALAAGDIGALGRALPGSFAERARARLVPGFAAVCERAVRAGAAGATLSGAGPAIVAVVDSGRTDPERVANAMVRAFATAGVRSEAHVTRVAPGARIVSTGT